MNQKLRELDHIAAGNEELYVYLQERNQRDQMGDILRVAFIEVSPEEELEDVGTGIQITTQDGDGIHITLYPDGTWGIAACP